MTNPRILALLLVTLARLDAAEQGNAANSTQLAEGSFEGLVTFHGAIPKSPTSDDAGIQRDLLQVDQQSRGLANVVVWLIDERSNFTGGSFQTPPRPALMDQRDHEFVPRVVAVLAGQPVKFSNSDPANHNVRTSSPQKTNEFNVFTGVDGAYTRSFVADPQQKPVLVGCDIHPWMRGWIYVFKHPYFAVTDERGRFRISSVPAGKYTLAVRQPDIKFVRDLTVVVSNKDAAPLKIEIREKDINKSKE